MRYTQNTSVVRPRRFSNQYQFGIYVAVQFMLEVEIGISGAVMSYDYC